MTDVHNKKIRSYNMSQVKAKDTKPELIVRKYLFACGFRYRLHNKKLPGKPDIVLPKYKTILFINGCFWHGHKKCAWAALPKTRTEWWQEKINKNIANDEKVIKNLRRTGWKVIVVWTCDLKASKRDSTLFKLLCKLKK